MVRKMRRANRRQSIKRQIREQRLIEHHEGRVTPRETWKHMAYRWSHPEKKKK